MYLCIYFVYWFYASTVMHYNSLKHNYSWVMAMGSLIAIDSRKHGYFFALAHLDFCMWWLTFTWFHMWFPYKRPLACLTFNK